MAPSRASKPAQVPAGSAAPRKTARARTAVPQAPEAATEPPKTAADTVDAQLAMYRSMRDFGLTAEPSGDGKGERQKSAARNAPIRARSGGGLPFVIQKHAASHLHYDFRLGWSGVLKSWAVAKGPSFYTGDRRLAVQVEDHPMEYGGFEGIIPKGQYGGGTVMVWDQGTWWPQPGHENVDAGLRTGSLKFEMHGTKMRGKWTLVRMHTTRPAPGADGRWKSSEKPQWLLIKEHDSYERPRDAPGITEEAPDSALTGRTMEEIARQEDHVWNSRETAGSGQAWKRQDGPAASGENNGAIGRAAKTGTGASAALTVAPRRPPKRAAATSVPLPGETLGGPSREELEELPPEPQPEFLQPQLAQETEAPPEGEGWLHELKLDGYRMQARKSARGVQMLTRSGLDWTYRVPAVAEAVAALPAGKLTLDGEVVVLAADGTTNFADLQASFQEGARNPLTFFCFDLLHVEGYNPRNLPLRRRKELLAKVLPAHQEGVVRLSEHIEGEGGELFRHACELHAEGIVSKRAASGSRAGRGTDWLKAKCLHEQEFVIGGYSLSADGPDRIGSLLLGYFRGGKLIYAGRTGTGFTQKMRRDLRTRLGGLESRKPPFATVPAEARRGGPVWVQPQLVAQVRFATWTAEDLVRQAAFLGLREDKRPEEVFREEPTTPPRPKHRGPRQEQDREQDRKPDRKPDRTPGRSGATAQSEPPAAGTERARKAPADRHSAAAAKTAAKKAAAKKAEPKTAAAKREGTGTAATTGSAAKVAPRAPVRLTHPVKVLDPESGLTKQQLADYYWAVAERMLPHVADRPLSLVRCPDGAGKPCFYQKHVNHMLPPGVGSVMVKDKRSSAAEPYITLSSPEALAGLAQMGVLEVHPWAARNEDLEHPDRLIFDLDPDETLSWNTVCEAAAEVRTRLKAIGLESFLKTTGGKGLHIVAPILPRLTFAEAKEAAHQFVLKMERRNPALYLTKMTKAARKGKIYLDYLRNERGATAVAPFSPRARPGVPVSVTLDWKELRAAERPVFRVADFAAWRDRLRRDPWKRMLSLEQAMDPGRLRGL